METITFQKLVNDHKLILTNVNNLTLCSQRVGPFLTCLLLKLNPNIAKYPYEKIFDIPITTWQACSCKIYIQEGRSESKFTYSRF